MSEHDEHFKEVLRMSPQEQDEYFAKLPPDGTSTLLVADLMQKAWCKERDEMIDRAKGFWYDDFKSISDAACPKIMLHEDLKALGYHDLAENVRDGKYD